MRASGAGGSLFENSRFFTGRELDSEIPGGGLYHYRHRSYDPSLGRVISRDPLGIWGDPNNLGNPLAYVGMMPWGYTDPFGLYTQTEQVRGWQGGQRGTYYHTYDRG